MARGSDPRGQAPIVAELGRPETPEETAARKAASSKRYRDAKTSINLVVALVASLAIVLVTVMIVVRPSAPEKDPVDVSAIAAQVQPAHETTIADPEVPEGWWANAARIESGPDGVVEWYVGYITPGGQAGAGFIGLTQGIDANPTWLAATLENGFASGTQQLGGVTWDIYDRRDADDAGNLAYAMTTVIGSSTVVLHGTATEQEFAELATAVASELSADSNRPSTTDEQEAE